MSYVKTNWVDNVTEVSAGNLNKIEQGIFEASTGLMPKSGGMLENYTEKLVITNGEINLSDGNVFYRNATVNTTFTITNAVASQSHSFTLIIDMGATIRTLSFPASVKWQGGEIPDLSTASKTYVLTFVTIDGGTNWLGMFGGEF